jgi:hypothetical protein
MHHAYSSFFCSCSEVDKSASAHFFQQVHAIDHVLVVLFSIDSRRYDCAKGGDVDFFLLQSTTERGGQLEGSVQ